MQEKKVLGIRMTPIAAVPVSPFDETRQGTFWFDLRTRRPAAALIKRLFDFLASLILIVLLSPLFLVLAALVSMTSPGPAIFRQRRIGFRCNEFAMFKFRTMRAGAERLQRHLAAAVDGDFFKLENDPRVTPIGRWLRRFSLDELPQLFNVLEGTMSLVGPRPLLPSDLETLPMRGQMRRFSMKPGITGLWQVSGRSETSDAARIELDRQYVNEWSLLLDFVILLKTIKVVLSGRGAA